MSRNPNDKAIAIETIFVGSICLDAASANPVSSLRTGSRMLESLHLEPPGTVVNLPLETWGGVTTIQSWASVLCHLASTGGAYAQPSSPVAPDDCWSIGCFSCRGFGTRFDLPTTGCFVLGPAPKPRALGTGNQDGRQARRTLAKARLPGDDRSWREWCGRGAAKRRRAHRFAPHRVGRVARGGEDRSS